VTAAPTDKRRFGIAPCDDPCGKRSTRARSHGSVRGRPVDDSAFCAQIDPTSFSRVQPGATAAQKEAVQRKEQLRNRCETALTQQSFNGQTGGNPDLQESRASRAQAEVAVLTKQRTEQDSQVESNCSRSEVYPACRCAEVRRTPV